MTLSPYSTGNGILDQNNVIHLSSLKLCTFAHPGSHSRPRYRRQL